MRLAGSVAPVGTAVCGEDDESDEEAGRETEQKPSELRPAKAEDDDDDWKYCQQAETGKSYGKSTTDVEVPVKPVPPPPEAVAAEAAATEPVKPEDEPTS